MSSEEALTEEALTAWEERLYAADADLQQRQEQALAEEPTAGELLALAGEKDKYAHELNVLADAYDARARMRDLHSMDGIILGAFPPDRRLSGRDRDGAAGDRAEPHDDRQHAADARHRAAMDRHRAAEDREAAVERVHRLEADVAGLREALAGRTVIGQAQGLLMARYDLTVDSAFATLVRLSQERNVKLRDVAAAIVDEASSAVQTSRDG